MLQQTQVLTVLPYFERFLARFPDVETLARGPIDEVLHLWSGLGYYARARHLHAAAALMCKAHGGDIPRDPATLMTLPGIGRSTAGAILSLAAGQRQPILDGNVKRVLARHQRIVGWPGRSQVLRELWQTAEARLPDAAVNTYNQGLMDLGAAVCTPRSPACERCPVSEDCQAAHHGEQELLPTPRPRRNPLPERDTTLLMIRDPRGAVLLERRPPHGVWGGLWSFPELEGTGDATPWCLQFLGAAPLSQKYWPSFRHTFSHFRLTIQPLEILLFAPPQGVMEGDRWVWYNMTPPGLGVAAPVARLLEQLDAENRRNGALRPPTECRKRESA